MEEGHAAEMCITNHKILADGVLHSPAGTILIESGRALGALGQPYEETEGIQKGLTRALLRSMGLARAPSTTINQTIDQSTHPSGCTPFSPSPSSP